MTSGKPMRTSDEVVIREPSSGWLHLDLREVWRYREVLGLLVWRDTIVLYKQSVAGVGWAVLRPLFSMVVLSVVFGRLMGLPSDGSPTPIFIYAALLPWGYFSSTLNGASNSLIGSVHLMSKVYFPRLILPLSSVLSSLVDFGLSFLVLVGLMVWYRGAIVVGWGLLWLPAFLLLAMAIALGVGLWLGAWMARYRDVRHLLPFLTQVWMYLTPVAYSATLVPPRWRILYGLNPMVGVVEGFRWAILGRVPPHGDTLALSIGITAVILVTGLGYFRRTERTVVDII